MNIKLYIIAGIIFLAQCAAIKILYDQNQENSRRHSEVLAYSKQAMNRIELVENDLGNMVAKQDNLSLNIRDLRELREAGEIKYLDQIEGLKKNLRNLESTFRAESSINYQELKLALKDTTIIIDRKTEPIAAQTFSWHDQWNSISGIIAQDTIMPQIDIQVPLTGAVTWDRTWFLGKKHYEFQITSENDAVTFTGLQSINVRKKGDKR